MFYTFGTDTDEASAARNGHFGRTVPGFTWERKDMAAKLKKAAAKWMK